MMTAVGVAEEIGRGYLRLADRFLPGRVVGFYLTGSTALGEFVPGRSDLDFVAVLDRGLDDGELRRLRLVQAVSGARTIGRAVRRRWMVLSGTCNGVFVREADLRLPVTAIKPVASHVAERFFKGKGFDVNPVMWKVLLESGVALRGPEPSSLGLDPEPARLISWNRDNLDTYWRSWGKRMTAPGRWSAVAGRGLRYGRLSTAAAGVLGAPRLHCTIATGRVIGKLSAGRYALDTFDSSWHPLIETALSYWRREPVRSLPPDLARQSGRFVLEVVDSALKGNSRPG